ncbi:MAG: hypothetical protein K0S32_1337 [Bacteroidetes bacterium]|jgi:hypothetical protein|nr:hypothetical protein [Bacteroidota bacterium]
MFIFVQILLIMPISKKTKAVLVLVLLFEMISGSIRSNPGDTTWVTIWNQRKLTYYGNYDTTASLPTGLRYRKIRMHYILGRYACPAGSQYCGSWDYTTQIYAKPPGTDTVEIARIITPYATDWLTTNRKHDYVVDVTDYSPVLDGNLGFMFRYEGYSFGFTITLKLELIEGVPPMDAQKVKNIYDGYYAFGKTADPIENHLSVQTMSYASPGSVAMIKNSISGHGSDDTQCSEFCSKYYQLKLNSSQIAQHQIWRNDCGSNDVYPQTGTWLYERANWCPGAVVWPIYHDITSLTTANNSFSVDIDMEPYTAPNQANAQGGYNFISQLVSYSAPNHSVDVSIEDIVSPTQNENFYRSNPACHNPVIRIKNVGTNSITTVVFSYGLKNQAPLTHTWTGSLAYLQQTDVVFPPSLSIYTNNVSSDFQIAITSVNGNGPDQNNFNDTYISKTSPPIVTYPKDFVIFFAANNATNTVTQNNETSYKLEDENGNIIMTRNNVPNLTSYSDTVHLQPGCYKLTATDSGCDGFSWWAYQYYTPNPGTGALRFNYTTFNTSFYTMNGDFGCSQVKYFRVANTTSTSVNESVIANNFVEVFPNPATDQAFMRFDLKSSQDINYKIIDLTGKIIFRKHLSNVLAVYETIDLHKIASGSYVVCVELKDGTSLNRKLIIQK